MDIGHVQSSKSRNAVSFGDRKQTQYSGRTQMTLTDDADRRKEDFLNTISRNVEVHISHVLQSPGAETSWVLRFCRH